ncbi:hypothetical protein ACJIZ3_023909 [Penstemon smallii]|uniref:Uncharacterized protein n=1 Tax=Penstemon smallii TaxID=265156 RepID=A0ABD3TSB9_9LAMI
MLRHGNRGVMIPTKIRKRGCSSSSSSSSRIQNYRLNKKPIIIGKNRAGLLIGSRSSTPVPTWRTTPLRSGIGSPKYSQSGKSTRPVSARKLAATLWGMNNGMPSPKMSESNLELMMKKKKSGGSKMVFKREKMQSGWGLHSGSGFLPPHLSDPSHSPTVSEKMDRYGTSSRHRKTPSITQRLQSVNQNVGPYDSISNASFMEIETRSRPQTSSGSVIGGINRLKDVSNALTTSKELLKIINRVWAQENQPSSSISLISALHAELERARLQVNQHIQEQRLGKDEITHLIKCFAEERASWKAKEQEAVETAISSIASELEVERKLRKRLESLNKKLGKELENEKRARKLSEQACDELSRNINQDKAEVEKLKREVEKEREMLDLADKLREERVQMKLSEAKHQYEEKNSAVSKLRKQLEFFLGTKREKDEKRGAYLGTSNIGGSHQNVREDEGEVDDAIESKEESTESDLHSIELNLDNKGGKWANNSSAVGLESKKILVNFDESKARSSISELEKEAQRRGYFNEMQRLKSVKGVTDHVLSSSRLTSAVEYHSPSRQRDESWPLKDPRRVVQVKSSKSRMVGEGQSIRRSKW